MRKDAGVLCLLIWPAIALAHESGGPAACSGLTAARAFKDTTISSARMIGADAAAKTPSYRPSCASRPASDASWRRANCGFAV
jgi:hypothetical protein